MSTVPYHALLTDQLADERAKKNSLEQRGIAVITTSGTLVTITLGFVALATRAQTYVLGATVVVLLVVALVGLVLAAAIGLIVNLPARLPVVDAGELTAENGDDDLETVRAEHEVLAHLLTGLRQVNRSRARILFAALLVEVTALAVMAVAVVAAMAPIMG
ncbi:hypothetical protein [Amycolatopsis taiwanensis]|uniref:Uncharacterized protein n=1 Tax=Amycolatopsis taiwanensis TaxID=342230 RepID=A0A9W6R7I1_9PSEU|nr:hypothetical protein [Amycolatopsis taiwanensis]GLY70698.1 hypothetical protein Atai01_73170 [Amycolatopsis taiwanensis]